MSNKGSKRSKELTSDESGGDCKMSDTEDDFKPKKTKKNRTSRQFQAEELFEQTSKRSARKVKESAYDRQIRLAIEQSMKEEADRLARNQSGPNEPVETAPKNDKKPDEVYLEKNVCLVSGVEPEKSDIQESVSMEFPLIDIAEKEELPAIDEEDTTDKIVDLISPEANIRHNLEDNSLETKLKKSSEDEILPDIEVNDAKKSNKKATPLKNTNKAPILNTSSEKKVNKPRKKLLAYKSDSNSEDEFLPEKETKNQNFGSSKKSKKKTSPIKNTENPQSTEKKAKKTRKNFMDCNSESEDEFLPEKETNNVDPGSGKKSKKKATPSNKNKVTDTHSAKKETKTETVVEMITMDKNENKENNSSNFKLTDESLTNTTSLENVEFSNKKSLPETSTIKVNNGHSLLPKHVSKLPPEISKQPAPNLNKEAKVPTNPVFKSVANAARLNNSLNENSSPLGRIEIKNTSPCVRVGLSRNRKIPSLHKNVKPLI